MSRHRGSSFLAVVSWAVRLSGTFLLRFVNRSGNCCSSPAFSSLVELSTCVFGPWHLTLLTPGLTWLSGFRSPLATARVAWAARCQPWNCEEIESRARRLGQGTLVSTLASDLVQRVSQVPFLLVRRKVDQHLLPLSLFACSACGSFDVSNCLCHARCLWS